jgi:hypothetical protein
MRLTLRGHSGFEDRKMPRIPLEVKSEEQRKRRVNGYVRKRVANTTTIQVVVDTACNEADSSWEKYDADGSKSLDDLVRFTIFIAHTKICRIPPPGGNFGGNEPPGRDPPPSGLSADVCYCFNRLTRLQEQLVKKVVFEDKTVHPTKAYLV